MLGTGKHVSDGLYLGWPVFTGFNVPPVRSSSDVLYLHSRAGGTSLFLSSLAHLHPSNIFPWSRITVLDP